VLEVVGAEGFEQAGSRRRLEHLGSDLHNGSAAFRVGLLLDQNAVEEEAADTAFTSPHFRASRKFTHSSVVRDESDHHPFVLSQLLAIESIGETCWGLWRRQSLGEQGNIILV
jgi:hypothetical protein